MPATRLPAFQFYPADWLKDPALRSVSMAARGLWIDLLCLMSECKSRGYLHDDFGKPLNYRQISRMTGCPSQTVKNLLTELISCGVASVLKPDESSGYAEGNSERELSKDSRSSNRNLNLETPGVLYSRRMVKDELKRQQNRENGAKGGNPQLIKSDNQTANQNRTPSSSSSSSSSASDSNSRKKEKDTSHSLSHHKPDKDEENQIPQERTLSQKNRSRTGVPDYVHDWAQQFASVYIKKTAINDIPPVLYDQVTKCMKRLECTEEHAFKVILELADRYSRSRLATTSKRAMIPSPASWLRSGRWLDDQKEWNYRGISS